MRNTPHSMAAATLTHIPTSISIAIVRLMCASFSQARTGLAFQTLL
ncbi:hypothetical protein KNHN1_21110 [Pseudomonas guariconensis]